MEKLPEPKPTRPTGASTRRELRAWYASDLHPKLSRAARRGVIRPTQAADFERLMHALLGGGERGRP